MAERAAELESSEFDVVFSAAHMLRWVEPSARPFPCRKRIQSTRESGFRGAYFSAQVRGLLKRPRESFGGRKAGPQMSFPSTQNVKETFPP